MTGETGQDDPPSIERRVLDCMSVEAAVLDESGTVADANRRWRLEGGTSVGARFPGRETTTGEEHLDALVTTSVERVLAGRSDHVELEVPVDGPDGQRWKLLLLDAVPGGGAVVTRVDVTRSHEVLDLVSESALHDPLTRLPSRSLVRDRIATAIARTQRGRTAPVVLFLDLDDFKVVNDELGHEMGDRVLAVVARRLGSSLRSADTCGRWGGDEFVAVVDIDDRNRGEVLSGLLDRIAETLERPIEVDATRVCVGVSIGAVLVRPEDSPAGVVALADAAMYEAKRSGVQAAVAERDALHLRLV